MKLNIRDEAMSKRIQELLSDGSCTAGVLFVGKAHVTADEVGRVTLKNRLLEAKVKLSTFIVQHASDPGPDKLASWSKLCAPNSILMPELPVIFSTDIFGDQTPIWPRMRGSSWTGGLWRDFDYVILTP